MGTPEWHKYGLCAQVDPWLWFPDRGGNSRPAKRICAACPVRVRCLTYALDEDIRDGIWGGKSVRERDAMRVEQRRQVAA